MAEDVTIDDLARATGVKVRRMIAGCAHGYVAECRILEVLGDHGFCRDHAH